MNKPKDCVTCKPAGEKCEHEEVDCIRRGFGICANNSRKTHCLKGHLLSGDNLIPRNDEYRACKECQNERSGVYKKNNRERLLEYAKAYHLKKKVAALKAVREVIEKMI